ESGARHAAARRARHQKGPLGVWLGPQAKAVPGTPLRGEPGTKKDVSVSGSARRRERCQAPSAAARELLVDDHDRARALAAAEAAERSFHPVEVGRARHDAGEVELACERELG